MFLTVVAFPTLRIVPYRQEYLLSTVELIHSLWHLTYSDVLPEELLDQRTTEYFEGYITSFAKTCWLAFKGQDIAGVLIITSNCIDALWVSEKYQRQKVGTALIDKAFKEIALKGHDSVQVGCESFNVAAVTFFQSLGWRQIASEPLKITPGHEIHALVLGKKFI